MARDDALMLDDFQADRRGAQRIPLSRAIVILPCNNQPDWSFRSVTLCDCSPHGLAILSDQPMKHGEEFLAKIKVQRKTMVVYRVCYCQAQGPTSFKIGPKLVEFVGTPDEILLALLAQEDSPPPAPQIALPAPGSGANHDRA